MAVLFPFDSSRGGQREFMNDVEETIRSGGCLAAHAPTGIGKTVGVLAPALEYALANGKTIFFLTPKHTQHAIVVETIQSITRKHDVRVVMVDVVGKQWMCPHQVLELSSGEFNEFCRSKKKDESCVYYNNVRKGRLSKNAREVVEGIRKTPMHNEEIQKLCSKKNLCPYEVCIEAGRKADLMICDYYHVFSPKVREAFMMKLGKQLGDSILVVDEAHNLPERIREIMSTNLVEYTLRQAINEAMILGARNVGEDLDDIRKTLKELGGKLKREDERYVEKKEFMAAVEEKTHASYGELVDLTNNLGGEVLSIPKRHRSYAKSVSRFLESWRGEDLGYARILSRDIKKRLKLSYKCLDPSISCKNVFDEAHASVLMSGTLIPLGMYSTILGLSAGRTIEGMYPSPFPGENRLTLLVPGVTTKYSRRSDYMYARYAKIIAEVVEVIPGNVAVFYPAYHLLESVLGRMKTKDLGKEVLVERKEMKKNERRMLYNRLVALADDDGGVLMGVQAGSFSEGVDYPGKILDAVVIVGLPLEKPDLESNALINYYEFKFERGWDYGYIYPAMNRALQAAGRCIRSEMDKGAVVLLDDRFKWANYRKCFPPDYEFIVTETPRTYLREFFKTN